MGKWQVLKNKNRIIYMKVLKEGMYYGEEEIRNSKYRS